MNTKAILSVGLNQNWANDKDRCAAVDWLKAESPVSQDAQRALIHIHALEGLLDVEKYATLSRMADDMKKNLLDIRQNQTDDENKAYQSAINFVMEKMESIDIDSQAATSIMEMLHEALLGAATLIRHPDSYEIMVNYANAIHSSES